MHGRSGRNTLRNASMATVSKLQAKNNLKIKIMLWLVKKEKKIKQVYTSKFYEN